MRSKETLLIPDNLGHWSCQFRSPGLSVRAWIYLYKDICLYNAYNKSFIPPFLHIIINE